MKIIKVPEDYESIQTAIDNAEAGDRVEVSAGEYRENIVMKEGVGLIGLSVSANEIDEAINNNKNEEKKLDSENASAISTFYSVGKAVLDGGNFGNVVSFKNGITGKTELAGFIIKNAGKSLSGVFAENSSPFIHDNVFVDNEYGIYIKGNSSPVIQKNVIQFSNKGIEVFNFEKMEEEQKGSTQEYEANDNKTNPIIVDNLITDNKIGIDLYQSSAVINHNAISYNNHYKTYLGATFGIYLSKSSAEIDNNIITDSGICDLCAGVNVDKESKNVVLKYNNIWNNKNNFVCFGECVMEDNNMSYDPMFVDYVSGSYKLSENSPLIGKAENGSDVGVRW
jgi:parallel beta-helix repeat protein